MYNNFYHPNEQRYKQGNMKIIGTGILKAEPNIAIINIGVITENINLKVAQSENAIKTNSVINTLLGFNIPKKDIQTSTYNIEAQYDYVESKQIFRGYQVTNILSVTIRDLMKVGEIIDAAVASGANRVYNIKFTIENPNLYYNQALKIAVRNAIKKAKEISTALGVELDEIPCKITEQLSQVFPQDGLMLKAASSTPILSGQIDITATLECLFSYKC